MSNLTTVELYRLEKHEIEMKNKCRPIEIAGIYNIYRELGFPKKIGFKIEAQMKSGKIGIYVLSEIRPTWNVDWDWYIFKFSHYKKKNEPIYPRYC